MIASTFSHHWLLAVGLTIAVAAVCIAIAVGIELLVEAIPRWRSRESLDTYTARRQIENEMLRHQVRMEAHDVRREIDDELRE